MEILIKYRAHVISISRCVDILIVSVCFFFEKGKQDWPEHIEEKFAYIADQSLFVFFGQKIRKSHIKTFQLLVHQDVQIPHKEWLHVDLWELDACLTLTAIAFIRKFAIDIADRDVLKAVFLQPDDVLKCRQTQMAGVFIRTAED